MKRHGERGCAGRRRRGATLRRAHVTPAQVVVGGGRHEGSVEDAAAHVNPQVMQLGALQAGGGGVEGKGSKGGGDRPVVGGGWTVGGGGVHLKRYRTVRGLSLPPPPPPPRPPPDTSHPSHTSQHTCPVARDSDCAAECLCGWWRSQAVGCTTSLAPSWRTRSTSPSCLSNP